MAMAKIEEALPSLLMHKFSDELLNVSVNFEVLKLKDSLFIWVGGENRNFTDLGIAMHVPPSEVTSSRILGSVHMQTPSDLMMKRISTKLKKPIYLSYNLPMDDTLLMKAVEKKIQSEFSSNPDNF